MPLYKLFKKADTFVWTKQAQQALESLKASLTSAPILIAPKWGELLLYVTTSNHVVSAALVIEGEEPGHHLKVQ